MDIRPVRTNEDHRAALAEIEASWGSPEGTQAGDKLDVLLALVEIYEAKRWPLDSDAIAGAGHVDYRAARIALASR